MKDDKIKIIIIILIMLIFVVAIGGTILYLTTDMLKSSETLFKKYISQDVQNIANVFEVSKEEKNIDLLRKTDYIENSKATLKYLEKENDEEEVYEIKGNAVGKSSENASYRNITASYGENTLMSIDLLKQNNMYGFRLANLVQQFVSVENATVPYFVSSLGMDGSRFSEKLSGVDISGILDFSDEEIEKLAENYSDLIFSDIDGKHYSSKKNVLRTLNNKQSVTTNAYSLTLTKNEMDKIYKKILNQAIKDEILLSKLDLIDSKIQEMGIIEKEGKSLKEQYINNLQKIIDSIEYQGEDTRKTIITVYESKGTTVRTTIENEDKQIILDLDNTEGTTLSLKTIELDGQEEVSKLYKLGKADTESGRKRVLGYSDATQEADITINTVQTEEEINIEVNANYKNANITNLSFNSETNIKLAANEALPVNFEDKNNILLNNYEGEKALSILEDLKNRAITSIETSQASVNTKLLNKIILVIDEVEQERKQQEEDDIKRQIDKFNNKFIFSEGENIEKEYVLKLIKTAGENMTDYKVISGNQIKIFIKENSKNEEKANEIYSAINESRATFNIKLNYGQDGYVESIDITVYEKK